MKIKLPAAKLTDADMEKVSLVKHGANRAPFRILKAEPLPADGSLDGVAARVRKMFEPKDPPKVTAIFVAKGAAKQVFPLLEKTGYVVKAEAAELLDNVVVLKQDGYDPQGTGDIIALSENVAVGFDRVVKDFCGWHATTDFMTTLTGQSFYPSVRMASEALMETVYQIGYSATDPADMAAKIEAATKAFAKHVAGLSKVLPVELFKMEQVLSGEFGARTVASTESIHKSEGTSMKTTALREAVAGDLAGLFDTVTKTEGTEAGADAAMAAADAEAAAAAAQAAADDAATAAAQAAADEAAAGAADAAAAGAAATGADEVTDPAAAAATAAAGAVDATEIVKALRESLGVIATKMDEQAAAHTAALADLTARLATVEKSAVEAVTTAKAAVAKADNTVVVHDVSADNDLEGGSLATRTSQGRVRKSEQPTSVFKGLFPALDALEDRFNGGSAD